MPGCFSRPSSLLSCGVARDNSTGSGPRRTRAHATRTTPIDQRRAADAVFVCPRQRLDLAAKIGGRGSGSSLVARCRRQSERYVCTWAVDDRLRLDSLPSRYSTRPSRPTSRSSAAWLSVLRAGAPWTHRSSCPLPVLPLEALPLPPPPSPRGARDSHRSLLPSPRCHQPALLFALRDADSGFAHSSRLPTALNLPSAPSRHLRQVRINPPPPDLDTRRNTSNAINASNTSGRCADPHASPSRCAGPSTTASG